MNMADSQSRDASELAHVHDGAKKISRVAAHVDVALAELLGQRDPGQRV